MNSKLTKALEILYDMETNNYYMTRTIGVLNEKISRLGVRENIEKPHKRDVKADEQWMVVSVLFGLVLAVIGFIYGISQDYPGFKSFFYPTLFAFVGFFGGMIVGFVIMILIISHYETKESDKQYKQDCNEYEERINADFRRVEQENFKKRFLIEQRDLLINKKSEATQKLNTFYSAVGIADEFRNIIPIGYMYEFARLGISTKLEGVDGLYYLVHKELRADKFQLSLDEISRKLDRVIDENRCIYSELKLLNQKSDILISKVNEEAIIFQKNNKLLQDINENTGIARYNSERIAKELEYQTFIKLWNTKGSYWY